MSGVRNFLSADVQIKGEIMFVGELQIDGRIEGSILSDGNLFVGERACVEGDAHVGNAIVAGKMKGNVVAAGKVDLKSGAELLGDIASPRLAMDEGATFVGRIDVNPNRGQPQPTARPAQSAQSAAPAVPAGAVAASTRAEPVMISGAGPKMVPMHR